MQWCHIAKFSLSNHHYFCPKHQFKWYRKIKVRYISIYILFCGIHKLAGENLIMQEKRTLEDKCTSAIYSCILQVTVLSGCSYTRKNYADGYISYLDYSIPHKLMFWAKIRWLDNENLTRWHNCKIQSDR